MKKKIYWSKNLKWATAHLSTGWAGRNACCTGAGALGAWARALALGRAGLGVGARGRGRQAAGATARAASGTAWARRGARSAVDVLADALGSWLGRAAGCAGHGQLGGLGAQPGHAASQRAVHSVHSACFWPDLTQYCS